MCFDKLSKTNIKLQELAVRLRVRKEEGKVKRDTASASNTSASEERGGGVEVCGTPLLLEDEPVMLLEDEPVMN